MMKDPRDLVDANTNVLAKLLGVTQQTINNMVKSGVITPTPGPSGHFNLVKANAEFIQYKALGGIQSERSKKTKEETRKLKLINDEREGKLVSLELASGLFATFCQTFKAGSQALPGRLANKLAGMSKPADIRVLIHAEVSDLLGACEKIFAARFSDAQRISNGESGTRRPKTATRSKQRKVVRRKQSSTKNKR